MLRMSAVLLLGLYAMMVIWGAPIAGDVAVTRDDTSPAVGQFPAAATSGAPPTDARSASSDISDGEAVRMALAAGEKATRPVAVVAAEPRIVEEAPTLWYVTGSRVNLRAGPSVGSAIVGGVGAGDRAEVLSDPGAQWTKIRTERGIEAWIYSRFLAETPA